MFFFKKKMATKFIVYLGAKWLPGKKVMLHQYPALYIAVYKHGVISTLPLLILPTWETATE